MQALFTLYFLLMGCIYHLHLGVGRQAIVQARMHKFFLSFYVVGWETLTMLGINVAGVMGAQLSRSYEFI